ncbi:hypothetical protein L6164_020261 [Bauhinia variegata]|uniref:Uncharacterized protein n=1 Tax=Bauhinia variegata TaxID=167791 RepID=A0ACB9MUU5_BAUVA|nr:hypothetical protein L6164_020261 [Bauhinia variegata]
MRFQTSFCEIQSTQKDQKGAKAGPFTRKEVHKYLIFFTNLKEGDKRRLVVTGSSVFSSSNVDVRLKTLRSLLKLHDQRWKLFRLLPSLMASIRHLSESVRSSVRSGIFLFNLTRVVEELVFNSLDAGARKVTVFVGVESCYVKVVDDGAGITRDGLVLVGERYATSKFLNLADLDATSGSFGFRGEALASISEVSLLEIVTRTYGIPNGYRKVLKGCKCLYLGIDDERKEVGTSVIVRDLFYNQPVRRKHMQSSLKKVLQSVKKCVLRLALVRPNILYKVVDIESEDELLCTHSSSSPLSLLSSGFGVEVSSSLRELQVQDDMIKLCGYISGPCNSFSLKALQYVCIHPSLQFQIV